MAEALAVTYINISSAGIIDITGIKSFKNLKTFIANDNKIPNFNVSGMDSLEEVQAHCNDFNNGSLFNVDVSKCRNLKYFSDTYNKTTSINLDSCFGLLKLNINSCFNLPAINLAKCVNLEELSCSQTDLSVLDLSKNVSLKKLDCSYLNYLGFGRLLNLDLSKNVNLVELTCNSDRLDSLNLSGNANLENLTCYNNKIKKLDFTHNPAIKFIQSGSNEITDIILPNNPSLLSLEFFIDSVSHIDLSHCPALSSIECSFNPIDTLVTTLNPNLQFLSCSNTNIRHLNLNNRHRLKLILAENNPLTSINLTNCDSLNNVQINNNQLANLDLFTNEQLSQVLCRNNKINAIIFPPSSYIYRLDCSDNKLASLDASQLTSLYSLQCNNNFLTYLNIKNGTNENIGNELNFKSNPLTFICADSFQVTDVTDSVLAYGMGATVSASCNTLPLGLISFFAKHSLKESVETAWETSSESNISSYILQKSSNGTDFNNLKTFPSLNQQVNNYTYKDIEAFIKGEPVLYYRLKMIKKDYGFFFSKIEMVKNKETHSVVSLYPNPAANFISISSADNLNENIIIKIYSVTGTLEGTFSKNEMRDMKLDISWLKNGVYNVQFSSKKMLETVRLIIIK